jgi:hypothetical protein
MCPLSTYSGFMARYFIARGSLQVIRKKRRLTAMRIREEFQNT